MVFTDGETTSAHDSYELAYKWAKDALYTALELDMLDVVVHVIIDGDMFEPEEFIYQ
jgi:hypothetical protein